MSLTRDQPDPHRHARHHCGEVSRAVPDGAGQDTRQHRRNHNPDRPRGVEEPDDGSARECVLSGGRGREREDDRADHRARRSRDEHHEDQHDWRRIEAGRQHRERQGERPCGERSDREESAARPRNAATDESVKGRGEREHDTGGGGRDASVVQIEGHEQLRDPSDRTHDGEGDRRCEHARMATRRDRHRPHRAGVSQDGSRSRGLAS